MNRLSLPTAFLLAILVAAPLFAQSRGNSRGGGGSNSSFGSGSDSGFGANSGFGSGGGNSTFGFGDTSSFGQSTGMNALSSGLGGSATGLGRSSGSSSSGSGNSRNSRNSATNRNSTNRSSTGRNSATGMTGNRTTGRTNLGSFGMNNMMNRGMNSMGGNGRTDGKGVGAQQFVRPVILVNFDAPPPELAPVVVGQTATNALSANQLMGGVRQVQVNVDTNGVATLRGAAQTARERTLAAALLSLEPGVRAVKNEMTLPPQPSLPTSR